MKKVILYLATSASIFGVSGHLFADSPYFSMKDGDGFKRFSVSAGWLHAAPQGDPNPVNINTMVGEGTKSKVGDVTLDSVLSGIDQSTEDGKKKYDTLNSLANNIFVKPLITHTGDDGKTYLNSEVAGEATINGLSGWTAQGTGLKAEDVDTFGIMSNYYFTDHLSLEMKAGIPPKVDIKGVGQIIAPLSGTNTPGKVAGIIDAGAILGGDLPLKKDILVTDLAQSKKAASATAWLPAVEMQYQFGKSGVNKFRPYVGLGVMYAHFTHLKLDDAISNDLIASGHMIQNVLDGKAGAALDGKTSSANPKIKLEAEDAWAPIATLGATYDFAPNWFAVGSVSYAPMSGDAKITITDSNTGKELIRSKTTIDIDPLITYVGVGYRF